MSAENPTHEEILAQNIKGTKLFIRDFQLQINEASGIRGWDVPIFVEPEDVIVQGPIGATQAELVAAVKNFIHEGVNFKQTRTHRTQESRDRIERVLHLRYGLTDEILPRVPLSVPEISKRISPDPKKPLVKGSIDGFLRDGRALCSWYVRQQNPVGRNHWQGIARTVG